MTLEELEYQVSLAADFILASKKLVVFTGAGISTESGISDFRSPGGIWSRYDPEDFTIQKFMSSQETRRKVWEMNTESGIAGEAKPNQAHFAIAEMEKLGMLDCVITQNVDNLHQKAGNFSDRVFELHGNMRRAICLSCRKTFPIEEILDRYKEKLEPPECVHCQGIIKPDGVFFGEALPERILNEAIRRARGCDLILVIGSTLVVYPAALIPMYARESGAKVVIINLTPTPLDTQANLIIRRKAGEVMAKIIEQVKDKRKAK